MLYNISNRVIIIFSFDCQIRNETIVIYITRELKPSFYYQCVVVGISTIFSVVGVGMDVFRVSLLTSFAKFSSSKRTPGSPLFILDVVLCTVGVSVGNRAFRWYAPRWRATRDQRGS